MDWKLRGQSAAFSRKHNQYGDLTTTWRWKGRGSRIEDSCASLSDAGVSGDVNNQEKEKQE